jgi:hypothetical protein
MCWNRDAGELRRVWPEQTVAGRSLNSQPGRPHRRAPKVTVTRGGVSLCQKGVTQWLLFLVNCLLDPKRAKTSRGAAGEPPSSRPPAVECGRAPTEGGPGGGLAERVIHKG